MSGHVRLAKRAATDSVTSGGEKTTIPWKESYEATRKEKRNIPRNPNTEELNDPKNPEISG